MVRNFLAKNKRWQIYNKSSETMAEIGDHSVDLVVISPPFNDGLVYGQFLDKYPFAQYLQLMQGMTLEAARALSPTGTIIIEVADVVISDGYFVQLAGLLQDLCLDAGLFLSGRYHNYIDTDGFKELPVHAGTSYFVPMDKAENHSNLTQWLIFSKEKRTFLNGPTYYIPYERPEEPKDHHCPFPPAIRERFLEIGSFKPGDTVLEPFMGTGVLGLDVVAGGGNYYGYEIDRSIFIDTHQRFESLTR